MMRNTAPKSAPFVRPSGFTLVELMVVMAIIAMAAGLMTPSIADYFRNRAVDAARGELTSVLQRARFKAVSESRDISVLFFKEGVRIFDEKNRIFADESWTPQSSALAQDKAQIFYILGFAGGLRSNDPGFKEEGFVPSRKPYIPPYVWWETRQQKLRERWRQSGGQISDAQYDITGLVKITFKRDGTLEYGPGTSDVRSIEYRQDAPTNSDIIVRQIGNRAACFVDILLTGSSKSRIVVSKDPYYEIGLEEKS